MDLFFLLIVFVGLLIAGYYVSRFIFKRYKKPANVFEYLCLVAFAIFFVLFVVAISEAKDFYVAIDQINNEYTPLAHKYILTTVVFFMLALISGNLLWLKRGQVPPLIFVLSIIFQVINLVLSIAVEIQVADNVEEQMNVQFLFFPVINALLSFFIVFSSIRQTSIEIVVRNYQNHFLNFLHQLIIKIYVQPVWVLIVTFPVFVIVILILTLFGQDPYSITKVFTETTTWHFSQHDHPPDLGHNGHYLCTVAAKGHRSIVKPLRFGKRHGKTIIINRQLQVANAFEQVLEENFSLLHKIIRKIYDTYGYPISRYIIKPVHSDIIYILMKPAEYMFVIILYFFCIKPEEKIAKQYTSIE